MIQKTNGAISASSATKKKMYAYGYEITPPQSEERLTAIQRLLDSEHTKAKSGARTWEGRFVHEDRVTHILVVTDSPDQQQEVNRKLEAALKELECGFSMTAPLAVEEGGPAAAVQPPSAVA